MSARARLKRGTSRVLTPDGICLVVELGPAGVVLQSADGATSSVSWVELPPMREVWGTEVAAVHSALFPKWETLSESSQSQALARLEIVLVVTTGFSLGFVDLAFPEEPLPIFDPTTTSLTQRCASMARQLSLQRDLDYKRRWRILSGEIIGGKPLSHTTVLNWVRAYRSKGVWGLVDGRATRKTAGFETLDERFRELVTAETSRFNGDISEVRVEEVLRRVRVEAARQGVELDVPSRRGRQYVSWMMERRGKGTRAHRTGSLRDTSGYRHYPAMRPGQVVAIDATRSDVMVWDDLHDRAFSVEVLAAIDVATGGFPALRIVPKSANSIDASLLLYDVMRPFSMLVDGTTVSDWRWCGIPEAIDFRCHHSGDGSERPRDAEPSSLQGIHKIPSVLPEAIRCDHGSIFVSGHFTTLLGELGIDLILSRGSRPTDNSHAERRNETIQALEQQIAGFKGRNTFERGRLVGKGRSDGGRDLPTARELEVYLKRWIALEYNRSWHEGLVLPGATKARLTPLEMHDALTEATGRCDVLQDPSLLYTFLPIKWGTIQHDGVEFTNLTYDDPILDDFRKAAPGTFGGPGRKAPFYYDPRDVSKVYFAHPTTGEVHPISWRGAWRVNAPLTDKVLNEVRHRIRERGGNGALGKHTATEQIVRELLSLEDAGTSPADQAMLSAAAVRVDASQRDHLEAQLAAYSRARSRDPLTENVRERLRIVEKPVESEPSESAWAGADTEVAGEEVAAQEPGLAPQSQDAVIQFSAAWSRLREQNTAPSDAQDEAGW